MSKRGRTRTHVYVSGYVQGVYYRATTRNTAHDRGVDGWVKNLSNGRVEVVFEGPRDGVEAMAEWYHEGSPMVAIEDADVTFEGPDGETGSRIKR